MSPFLIPHGKFDRLMNAAQAGDPALMRVLLPDFLETVPDIRKAADNNDAAAFLKILSGLGIGVKKFTTDVLPYITLVSGAVDLINAVLEALNAETMTDEVTFTLPYRTEVVPFGIIDLTLTATVKKQVRGIDFLDNEDMIETIDIEFTSTLPVTTNTIVVLKAIGVGQDALKAPLVASGDGTGNAQPAPTSSANDILGLELVQVDGFSRTGTTHFKITTDPTVAKIVYGVNGASLALFLDVTCTVYLPDGTAFPMFAKAEYSGISV